MATAYSGWVAADDWRVVMTYSVSYPSSTTASVKVSVKVQSRFGWTAYPTSAVIKCGSQSATVTGPGFDTNDSVTVGSHTFTVSRGSSKQSVAVSAKVTVPGTTVAVYRTGTTARGTASVSAIAYSAPSAPSACSASRSSDAQIKVTWTNGSTSTTSPRSSTKVERQTDGGSWVQIASVGSSVKNYADKGVTANHRYRYRVRAYGSGGYSSYATSGYIYTTPAAPKSVSASVVDATRCRIFVDGSGSPWATGFEVQSSLNDGGWVDQGTFDSFPVNRDLGGGSVRLRARAVRGSLASAWVESESITTICPPLAPTVGQLPAVIATGTVLDVTWEPSHPDGSDQTSAQVELTSPGGSATPYDTGSSTSFSLALSQAGVWRVRVRTKGADEDWGEWSGYSVVTVADPPSVTITSPGTDGAVVDRLPLAVTWDASDETGVSMQRVSLADADGRELWSAQLGPDARSHEIGVAQYQLANETAYVIRVDVTGGSTLSASDDRDVTTDWVPPAVPSAQSEVGDDLSVTVLVGFGSSEGDAPDTTSVSVTRVLEDGSEHLVADGLSDGDAARDQLPPLNVPYSYRVTANTEAGATSALVLPVTIDTWDWAYNFGVDGSTCVRLSDDQEWDASPSRDRELYHFADGGETGGLPMAYESDVLDVEGSQSFTLLDESEKVRTLQRASRGYSVGWVRDPYGGRAYAAIDISLSGGIDPGVVGVKVSTSELVFREAASG